MLEKRLNSLHLCVQGLVFIFVGILVISNRSGLILDIFALFMLYYLLTGVLRLVDWILHPKEFTKLIDSIANFVIGFFIEFTPRLQLKLLPWLFGIMLLVRAFINIISYLLFKRNHVRGRWQELFMFTFNSLVGLSMMFMPIVYVDEIMILIGCYLILYGVKDIKDTIKDEMKLDTKNRLKRKFHLPVPDMIAAIIPYRVLHYINHYFEEHEQENKPVLQDVKEDVNPELEVLIHVSDVGFGKIGHVDLCYHGYIISYGNYDASSYHLHEMIGDGVLFVAPKEKYIPFCIADSQKTLFGFGLTLTPDQQERIDQELKKLFENVIPWQSPYEKAKLNGDAKGMEDASFYASRLYKNTGAKMYKFKQGPFKTYFVLKTNCVLLADEIIGKTGIDIVSLNGLITPGAYYDYFSRQFMIRGTNVVTRTIYHRSNGVISFDKE